MSEDKKYLEFKWLKTVNGTPKELWPFIADTAKFNRALGLKPRKLQEKDGVVHAKEYIMGIEQQWYEEPWQWKVYESIQISRVFQKGIAKFYNYKIELRPLNTGQTQVGIYFKWIPRNNFWRSILKLSSRKIKSDMFKLLDEIEASISKQSLKKDEYYSKNSKPFVSKEGHKKLSNLMVHLAKKGVAMPVVNNIVEHLKEEDELNLDRIKPLKLANKWDNSQQEVLRGFLHSVDHGALKLSWDVICPHCRGVRKQASQLSEINETEKCEVCMIDFKTNDKESIEVTFQLNECIRKIEKVLYCSAEPDKKPHIQLQMLIPPKSSKEVFVNLEPGVYRLRAVGQDNLVRLKATKLSGEKDLTFDFNEVIEEPYVHCETNSKLSIVNSSDKEQTFVLEEYWWHQQALKPSHVFALEEFKHLFSEEYLNNNAIVNLGHQAIMFTDIVGSTRLYEQMGDAQAFKLVKEHFDQLFDQIEKNNGKVVKTIGDAVMASFESPTDALFCSINIQNYFQSTETNTPLGIRVSLNYGRVIGVNIHGGIDYFGQAVNKSAKYQACVDRGEVACTEEFFDQIREGCITFTQTENIELKTTKYQMPGAEKLEKVFIFQISDIKLSHAS